MLGTGITIWAAFQNFGKFNIVIALAIATIKASLVVLYFMHARYKPKRFNQRIHEEVTRLIHRRVVTRVARSPWSGVVIGHILHIVLLALMSFDTLVQRRDIPKQRDIAADVGDGSIPCERERVARRL